MRETNVIWQSQRTEGRADFDPLLPVTKSRKRTKAAVVGC
jgi:hypothetical protein